MCGLWRGLFGDRRHVDAGYQDADQQGGDLRFEGDEIDTVVGQRVQPEDSSGWTAIIMEQASRFKKVMRSVAAYVGRTPRVPQFEVKNRRLFE